MVNTWISCGVNECVAIYSVSRVVLPYYLVQNVCPSRVITVEIPGNFRTSILLRSSTMSRLVFSAWQWELRVSFHRKKRIPSQPAQRLPGRPLDHRDGDDHGLKNSTASTSTFTTWILSGILSGILIAFEDFLVAFKELKDQNMDEFGPGREKKQGNHLKFPRKPRHAQSWNTGARVAMPPWHGAACHFLGFKQLNIKDVGLFNRFMVYWTSNNQKTHPGTPDTNMSPLKGSWEDDFSFTTVDMLIPRRIIPLYTSEVSTTCNSRFPDFQHWHLLFQTTKFHLKIHEGGWMGALLKLKRLVSKWFHEVQAVPKSWCFNHQYM